MDSMSRQDESWKLMPWVWVFALCAAFTLTHSFSSMATYDDESYVMITIKTFLDGDRLYAETFTQYGPAYYMIQQPIHGIMGVPITHDVVRLKTVATWLLLGLLSGIIVLKMTKSRLAGTTAILFAVLQLQNFGLEPAHPQELVALFTLIPLLLMNGRNRWLLFVAGICIAIAALSKLNAGAIVAVAALFAASYAGPSGNRSNLAAFVASSVLTLCVALGVTAAIANKCLQSGNWAVLVWPSIVSTAVVLLIVTAWKSKRESTAALDAPLESKSLPVLPIVLGGIVGSALIVYWAFYNGNSLDELLYGLVFQHSYMSKSFYVPLDSSFGALISLIAARLMLTRLFGDKRNADKMKATTDWLRRLAPITLFIALGIIAIECWKPLEHGLSPRGAGRFLTAAGPFLMPLLILRDKSQFRMALAMTACLSPLISFPVPGTQVALGTLPMLLALVVITFDARDDQAFEQPLGLACSGLQIALALVLLVSTVAFGNRWINGKFLDQPGCRWVRLDEQQTNEERRMVAAINTVDSPWLVFDNVISSRFYFWTDKKPVTSLLPSYWPIMLTPEQMSRVEHAVDNGESICVVKVDTGGRIRLETHSPSTHEALLKGWEFVEEVGMWQVGVRRK